MIGGECGGCWDLGPHTRWCPEVVGLAASNLGRQSERLDAIGDALGSHPVLANDAWALAARVRAKAEEATPHEA